MIDAWREVGKNGSILVSSSGNSASHLKRSKILPLMSGQNTTKNTGKIRCPEDTEIFFLTGGQAKYSENTAKNTVKNTQLRRVLSLEAVSQLHDFNSG